MLAILYLDGNPFSRKEINAIKPILNKLLHEWIFVGSYRRNKNICNDCDVICKNYLPANNFCKKQKLFAESKNIKVVKLGEHKARLLIYCKLTKRYIPTDIALVDNLSWPAALMHYTGSKEFNIAIRKIAIAQKYKLNEYGLWKNNKRVNISSEEDIFAKLHLPYKSPQER
jgi:DNA polymerase (family 10)